jgi:hypothetical protein
MFNLSLGAICPKPLITELCRIVNPAATAPVFPINDRLEIEFVFSFIVREFKFLA